MEKIVFYEGQHIFHNAQQVPLYHIYSIAMQIAFVSSQGWPYPSMILSPHFYKQKPDLVQYFNESEFTIPLNGWVQGLTNSIEAVIVKMLLF